MDNQREVWGAEQKAGEGQLLRGKWWGAFTLSYDAALLIAFTFHLIFLLIYRRSCHLSILFTHTTPDCSMACCTVYTLYTVLYSLYSMLCTL